MPILESLHYGFINLKAQISRIRIIVRASRSLWYCEDHCSVITSHQAVHPVSLGARLFDPHDVNTQGQSSQPYPALREQACICLYEAGRRYRDRESPDVLFPLKSIVWGSLLFRIMVYAHSSLYTFQTTHNC